MMIKMTHLGRRAFRTDIRNSGSWSPGCPKEAGQNVVTNQSLLPVRSVFRANGAAARKLYRVSALEAGREEGFSRELLRGLSRIARHG